MVGKDKKRNICKRIVSRNKGIMMKKLLLGLSLILFGVGFSHLIADSEDSIRREKIGWERKEYERWKDRITKGKFYWLCITKNYIQGNKVGLGLFGGNVREVQDLNSVIDRWKASDEPSIKYLAFSLLDDINREIKNRGVECSSK
jgi:hypothetical protein